VNKEIKPDDVKIAGKTLLEWQELATQSDALEKMTTAELREIFAAIRLRIQLVRSAVAAIEIATKQSLDLARESLVMGAKAEAFADVLREIVGDARKDGLTYAIRVSPETYRKARDLLREFDHHD